MHPEVFLRSRLSYYLSSLAVSHDAVQETLKLDQKRELSNASQLEAITEKAERFAPKIILVTATHNRMGELRKLQESIFSQDFRGKVGWIIIENGSTDDTCAMIREWESQHEGIWRLNYRRKFGYASPARNRGLAFAQWIFRQRTDDCYVWTIDSDDTIYDEHVIGDLYQAAEPRDSVLVHGFAACTYYDEESVLIATNSIPRDLGRTFPGVTALKEQLDAGPNVLSGLIRAEFIPHFYYPDEFTMEDDALSRRIMAWALKQRRSITAVRRPTLKKMFHASSMSGANAHVGSKNDSAQLGPVKIRGVRARIVRGLVYARDYFTREGV